MTDTSNSNTEIGGAAVHFTWNVKGLRGQVKRAVFAHLKKLKTDDSRPYQTFKKNTGRTFIIHILTLRQGEQQY